MTPTGDGLQVSSPNNRATRSSVWALAKTTVHVGLTVIALSQPLRAAPLYLPETGQFTMLQGSVIQALDQFGADIDLHVSSDPSLTQPVRKGLTASTPRGFLNRICTDYHLDWYFDGQTLFVTPASETVSEDVALDGVPFPTLTESLKARQISDARFPVRRTPDGQHITVFGPPRFRALVNQTIAALGEVQSDGVTIYRGSTMQKISPR
ncbi:hypothetical protein [Gluconobacter japonicus]|uniref:Type III secretion protein n=1 Tax=Gluconobacter japonicus TaxID=376620 RepID=A0ABQ5WK31_GLUJA|nr:hypothetical protein [Gluconobacter japonicus]KXV29053.1 hypothetical protein AD938_03010 [Gluconobacter japonicus]GLQ59881.1 hypothetical protein GCM10010937_16840 [Gluconobacter japonicus]